jgi:hypothetical protein
MYIQSLESKSEFEKNLQKQCKQNFLELSVANAYLFRLATLLILQQKSGKYKATCGGANCHLRWG